MDFNYRHLTLCVIAFVIVIVVGGYVFISRQTPSVVAVGFAVFIITKMLVGDL